MSLFLFDKVGPTVAMYQIMYSCNIELSYCIHVCIFSSSTLLLCFSLVVFRSLSPVARRSLPLSLLGRTYALEFLSLNQAYRYCSKLAFTVN